MGSSAVRRSQSLRTESRESSSKVATSSTKVSTSSSSVATSSSVSNSNTSSSVSSTASRTTRTAQSHSSAAGKGGITNNLHSNSNGPARTAAKKQQLDTVGKGM